MKKLYFALSLILAACILSGCAVFDGARMLDKEKKNTVNYVTPAPVTQGIGGTCEKTPWRISLTGMDTTNVIGTAPLDTKAADGMVLLILYFDVTNISETDEYFNYMYFTAEADGQKVDLIVPAATVIDEKKIAIGTVPKEKSASYYVIYQVPQNWSSFRIQYDIGGMVPNVLATFQIKA